MEEVCHLEWTLRFPYFSAPHLSAAVAPAMITDCKQALFYQSCLGHGLHSNRTVTKAEKRFAFHAKKDEMADTGDSYTKKWVKGTC